jgi:hypothetical protein
MANLVAEKNKKLEHQDSIKSFSGDYVIYDYNQNIHVSKNNKN